MNDELKDFDAHKAEDHVLEDDKKANEPSYAEEMTETTETETTGVTEAIEVGKITEPVYNVPAEPAFNKTLEKRNFSKIGFGFFIFSAINILIQLVIQIVVLIVSEDFYRSHIFLITLAPVSMYLFALPVLIAFFRKTKPVPPKKRSIGFVEWLMYLLVGFGLMYIGALIGNGVMSVLSSLVGYDYSNSLQEIVEGGNIWITAIFMVIVAPIGEEFVFRKLLIDRTGKYGCFISALLSGLIFGLMHGNLYQFFYASLLGFVLGYLYYNTGKLFYTISIHAVINFFGSVVTTLISEKIADIDMSTVISSTDQLVEFIAQNGLVLVFNMIFTVFIYGAMICAIVIPIIFRKRLTFAGGGITIPKGERASTVFLNAGIICMIIFYVAEMAMSLLTL